MQELRTFIADHKEGLLLFNFIIAINFLFFGLVLVFSSNKSAAIKVLAIILMAFGIKDVLSVLEGSKMITSVPHLIDANLPIIFLQPLLYYVFVRKYFGLEDLSKKQLLYHLIFPAVVILCYVPFYLLDGQKKLELPKEYWFNRLRTVLSTLGYGLNVFYLIISLAFIRGIDKRIQKIPIKLQKNSQWIRKLLLALLVVNLFLLFNMLMTIVFKRDFSLLAKPVYLLIYVFILFLFINSREIPYMKLNLSEVQAAATEGLNKTIQQINYLLEKERFFLDSNCTLQSFAEKLDMRPQKVSVILKTYFDQSFSELINSYRIEEAKQLLVKHPDYKIEAIGYDVGYNTRSVFYRNFKKYVGMSPVEFKRKI